MRNVVNAITEVIDVVVEELIWGAISGSRTWRRALLLARRCAFARFVLTRRTIGTASGSRFFLAALVLAFVLATAATATAVRAIASRATWVARVTHIRTLAGFRLLGFYSAGVETHQIAIGNLLLGHALDAFEQLLFVRSNQRDRFARTTGTAGTADTVNVIFIDVRQFEVDHVWQLVDVQTTSGDIGRHEDSHFTGLEVGQGFGPRVLALVAVDRDGGQAVFVQVLGQTVGAVFGTSEHQHLFPGACGDQVRQQRTLVVGRQTENTLFNALDRSIRRRDFNAFRVMQELAGEVGDVFGERRREQQVLPLARQTGQHLLHVMDKAHVEHAVGFVQHEDFHVGQVNAALTGEVEQSARAGHQHVDTTGHGLNLRVHADAAEDAGADEFQVTSIDLEAFVYLSRQFAGRRKDQHSGLAWAVALGFVRVTVGEQPLQNRKGEAAGFTSTCLSRNHQVATLQHGGDGPLLHRSRLGVARRLDGTD